MSVLASLSLGVGVRGVWMGKWGEGYGVGGCGGREGVGFCLGVTSSVLVAPASEFLLTHKVTKLLGLDSGP